MPPTPPAPKEVANKPTDICVENKALEADSSHMARLRRHAHNGIAIVPYYKEAFTGKKVKLHQNSFKDVKTTLFIEKEDSTVNITFSWRKKALSQR